MTDNHVPDKTRRRLVVGAAWATPAILLAAAAPAAAASTPAEFQSTIQLSTSGTSGSRGNVTVRNGSFSVIGSAGDSTGILTLTATAPAGYTTTLTEGSMLGEWTVHVLDDSPVSLQLTHPGTTIQPGNSSASVAFPGFVFTGTGATGTNFAWMNIHSTVFGDVAYAQSPGAGG